jgi:regulatory protein
VTDSERLQPALDLAYRFLGHRDRTVAEVRERLSAEGIEPAIVDGAVDQLHQQRIERRLLALGVDPALIAAALDERGAGEELEAAIAVLRRRFARAPADDRARDRALGLLVRKGYELELAYDAVRAFERDAA